LPICFNECLADGSSAMAWRCFEQDTVGVIDERRPKKRIKKHSRKL
jgi:hypothetical protein